MVAAVIFSCKGEKSWAVQTPTQLFKSAGALSLPQRGFGATLLLIDHAINIASCLSSIRVCIHAFFSKKGKYIFTSMSMVKYWYSSPDLHDATVAWPGWPFLKIF